MAHAAPESVTFENCAYRAGEALYRLGGAARQTAPEQVGPLVERGRGYMSQFLNHAGAMEIYPANAKRRLQALRRLKQYDRMEAEAAQYLGDENLLNFKEYDAVKNYMGEFPAKAVAGQAEASAEETSAVLAIQDAYYNRDYAQAKLLAADYLGKYPAGGARRAQAQGLMAGALVRRGEAQALIDFVEAALAAEPNHPLYAELRKAQGDALLAAMKQPGAAHAKYADAVRQPFALGAPPPDPWSLTHEGQPDEPGNPNGKTNGARPEPRPASVLSPGAALGSLSSGALSSGRAIQEYLAQPTRNHEI